MKIPSKNWRYLKLFFDFRLNPILSAIPVQSRQPVSDTNAYRRIGMLTSRRKVNSFRLIHLRQRQQQQQRWRRKDRARLSTTTWPTTQPERVQTRNRLPRPDRIPVPEISMSRRMRSASPLRSNTPITFNLIIVRVAVWRHHRCRITASPDPRTRWQIGTILDRVMPELTRSSSIWMTRNVSPKKW